MVRLEAIGGHAGSPRRGVTSWGGRTLAVVSLFLAACSPPSATVQPFAVLPAAAPVDPLTLPRWDGAGVTVGPPITFDWPDGASGDLSYGPGAIGVSEDGTRLYVGCNLVTVGGVAQLAIPAGGGRAKVVAPCAGVMKADIEKVMRGYGTPGWSWDAGTRLLGGVLEQGGRVCVTAFGSYDASNQAIRSHWCGPDLQHLAGPYGGTVSPGLVKANMGVIPSEWRALLGGPAFATAGYSSIISRSSYGAAFTVFDPADVTRDGFPMAMLLGCRHTDPGCNTYGTPTSNDYNGSELSGGSFIVPATRTLAVLEREASGPTCYGYATRDKTLHGTPYPTAANPGPENVPWCYSLSDPLNEKGPKGYPYRLVAKLYDLADLVAVKQGTKKPWDIRQYATVDLPGSSPNEVVAGGAFNPVTGDYYLLRYLGGGVNTIYTLRGFTAAPAPPPPPPPPPPVDRDCDGTWARVPNSETACVDVNGVGQRTYQEAFTKTVDPSGNGKACPASPRTGSEACALPPPPTPPDPCVASPIAVTVQAWPRMTPAATAARWTVTGPAGVTVAKAEWLANPQRLVVTDSRGCQATVTRPTVTAYYADPEMLICYDDEHCEPWQWPTPEPFNYVPNRVMVDPVNSVVTEPMVGTIPCASLTPRICGKH